MSKPIKHGTAWRIRWWDEKGVRQSAVFDDYKRAQTELKRREVEVSEIKAGVRDAPPPKKTINDLCDYWLENRAVRKRSKKDDQSLITRHLRPFFGDMVVKDVGTEDLHEFVNVKVDDAELSEKYVDNMLTLLRTMLGAAMTFKSPWLTRLPVFPDLDIALLSIDYRWLRTEEEIARFLAAARTDDEYIFIFYATAIYTGMRAGERAALERDAIDFDRRLITVKSSFKGPTKSNRVRFAPILNPLLPILKDWTTRAPGRLVFTNTEGRMFQPSARIYQEILHRVLDRAGLEPIERKGKLRPTRRPNGEPGGAVTSIAAFAG